MNGEILKVRFDPTSAIETPEAVNDLCILYKDAVSDPDIDALLVLPLMILDFLCIHPFKDGNGRVSRLLTLLFLYQEGYEVGRYISLERIFETQKEGYYEYLERSSQGWHEGKHDPFPWLNYFWGVLIAAYKEFEEKVDVLKESQSGRGSKTELIKLAVSKKVGLFSSSEIEEDCPESSRVLIKKVLSELKGEGSIESIGRGRGAKWKLLS